MLAEDVEKRLLIDIEKLLGQVMPEQRIYLLKKLLERNKISKGVFSSVEDNIGTFSGPLIEDDEDHTITSSGAPIQDALGWMDEAGALMRIFCESSGDDPVYGVDENTSGSPYRVLPKSDEQRPVSITQRKALTMLNNAEYREMVVYYGFRIDDEMRSKMSAKVLAELENLLKN